MRVKEISVGLSGVISTASWENLRPQFNVTAELEADENVEDCFAKLRKDLRFQFEMEANRAKTDLIERQYANIRFREKDGKKYPRVSSILGFDRTWRVTQDELNQYAARGTIVHKLVETYLKTGKWEDPVELAELKEEVVIVLGGSLELSWADCSYKLFMEKFGGKIQVEKTEQVVFNDERLYSGRYDIKGKFEGVSAIMDFKTGSFDMCQLAAYAVCETGIKRLVVLPVGPTENKCGFKKPVIDEKIDDQFKNFLRARAKFFARFGI